MVLLASSEDQTSPGIGPFLRLLALFLLSSLPISPEGRQAPVLKGVPFSQSAFQRICNPCPRPQMLKQKSQPR